MYYLYTMQNTTNTNAALAAAFSTFNGCTFGSIDTLTDVRLMGGKSNPLQGRVTKLKLGARVILGASGALYENRVNKMLAAEFGDNAPKFKSGERTNKLKRVGNSPVLVSTPKSTGVETYYLETLSIVKPSKVVYLVDGNPATDEQIAQIKATLPKRKPQAGLSEGVVISTPKFDSLIRVRMGGDVIVVNPDALKVVEAVAEAVEA